MMASIFSLRREVSLPSEWEDGGGELVGFSREDRV